MQPDLSSLKLTDPDGFYAALVAAHEGLDDATSALLNARLVMLLANQVGDAPTLLACIAAAAQPLRTTA
ncbi:MAG: DUF2783 domain-containing protein [Ramlibacter sp.]